MKALVAPDKFKGSLTAQEVALHLATGVRRADQTVGCSLLPLADGGDGSVQAALAAGFHSHPVTVSGPTGQSVGSEVAFDGTTAIVEVANTCGLSLLPQGIRQPMTASSLGFGEALRFALALRPSRVVLALGGSASTDGGMGLLIALGAVFRDAAGVALPGNGASLSEVSTVDLSGLVPLSRVELVIASDVESPLTGPTGAAAVFGPQKGADAAAVTELDEGLRHLSCVFESAGVASPDLARATGAGSAGGMGYSALLLGGRMVSGADFFLDLLGFDAMVADCDVVITGEGRIDEQTLQGKLPSVVAHRSSPRPVLVVVGRNDLVGHSLAEEGITRIYQLVDYTRDDPWTDRDLSGRLLEQIGEEIGRSFDRLVR